MQKRICSNCATRWYSSDTKTIWKCETCGHDIPVPNDELDTGKTKSEVAGLLKGGIDMEDSNIRILPHVCGNKECREFIWPPFENLNEFKDGKLELCQKCKDKK